MTSITLDKELIRLRLRSWIDIVGGPPIAGSLALLVGVLSVLGRLPLPPATVSVLALGGMALWGFTRFPSPESIKKEWWRLLVWVLAVLCAIGAVIGFMGEVFFMIATALLLSLAAWHLTPEWVADAHRPLSARMSAIRAQEDEMWDYGKLRAMAQASTVPLPSMFVNLDALEANAAQIRTAKASFQRIRIATKSIRVPDLIRRILRTRETGSHPDWCSGLMTFSCREAAFLAQHLDRGLTNGHDFLVAYPQIDHDELQAALGLVRDGAKITLMVDSVEHVELLAAFLSEHEASLRFRVCIDIDVSYRLPSLGLHLGVERSSIRSLEQLTTVAHSIRAHAKRLQLVGLMGYEAQIAGLPDFSPSARVRSMGVRVLKALSAPDVAALRSAARARLEEMGFQLEFVNGGGSGSIRSTRQDTSVTEITVGSGFLQSHLFDHYREDRRLPAFAYGLSVTRRPREGVLVCQSGGFTASGASGEDKQPVLFRPKGLQVVSMEGLGEVQSPIRLPSSHGECACACSAAEEASSSRKPGAAVSGRSTLDPADEAKDTSSDEEERDLEPRKPCCSRCAPPALGDPIFLRPAKAGEIAERFANYVLFRSSSWTIDSIVPTYRGLGGTFF